ncbi:redoxin domain-containing protein [Streptomyces filamentosus]|uniref:redoxin domain-containing protein n=1 Tax=Streptomyces filamentosus TaxID=67294 RepID=UPI0033E68145
MVGDFRLPGGHLDGETFHRRDYTLFEQRGRPLVLAFHPGDDTPVCTAQLCAYSDGLAELQSTGASGRGISPQGIDSNEVFARSHAERPARRTHRMNRHVSTSAPPLRVHSSRPIR